MQTKIKHFLIHKFLPILILLSVWEIGARIYNQPAFFPGVYNTFLALIEIIGSKGFLKIVLSTLMRVLLGILYGTIAGCALAILSYKFEFVHSLISPLLSVIKATPIASIIVLLWVSIRGNPIAIFIAFLIVFPIIWQNVYDAFSSIDRELIEVAKIYGFNFLKKLKILVMPTLVKYFVPAFITSIGLAFKAEIAAEIIAGISNSIGQMIRYGKDIPSADIVFAWTIIGITLSILVEWCAKKMLIIPSKTKKEDFV